MDQNRQIVLASTSRYRRDLLARLGLEFECVAPDADESELPGETTAGTAVRLATLKARAVGPQFADALVVGSDQVASCNGARLAKPGGFEQARRQLASLSGSVAQFDTAVSLLDTRSGALRSRVVSCRVTFRPLAAATIDAYLRREKPYDCAGSAKAEGLGIALIARIETEDPTSLIGLPLIALTELLADAGAPVIA